MWDPTEGQGQRRPHLAERSAAVQALVGWPEPGGQGCAGRGPSRGRPHSTTCFRPVPACAATPTSRRVTTGRRQQARAAMVSPGRAVLTASVAQAASGAGMRTGAPAACGAGTGPTAAPSAEAVGRPSPPPPPRPPGPLSLRPQLTRTPLPIPPARQLWPESCLPPRSHPRPLWAVPGSRGSSRVPPRGPR